LSILVIDETGNRQTYTQDIRDLLIGRNAAFRNWVGKKVSTEPQSKGYAFRMLDPDQSATLDSVGMQAVVTRPRTALPWVVGVGTTPTGTPVIYENTLTINTTNELIKLFGPAPAASAGVPQVKLGKVYDDNNYRELLDQNDQTGPKKTGLLPRSQHSKYAKIGSVPGTRLFSSVLNIIPRPEWPARIKAMDDSASWPTDYCDFICRDQKQTLFCWANGPATCVDVVRRQIGLVHVETSGASVACKINGFSNQGGMGVDALQYFASTGGVASSLWPNAAISRQYDTSTTMADRSNRKALEWLELDTNGSRTATFDQLATSIFLGHPVAVGYNWWGHEVTAVRIVQISAGVYGVEIRNSWGTWGSKNRWGFDGFSVLSESKGTPDDAFLLRSVTDSPYAQAL
jgi:hypothetical protein